MGKATVRKVTVPAKAVEPIKPVSIIKPVKRNIKAEVGKKFDAIMAKAKAAVPVPAPKPVTVAVKPKATPKPKVARIEHSIASLYTGPSTGLNKRKSGTVLDLALFNTKPDYVLSERSELLAETIKKEYGNKPFPRANLDAGVLKHLLMKGFIEAVSGQGGEDTTLRFTRQGLAYHRKAV